MPDPIPSQNQTPGWQSLPPYSGEPLPPQAPPPTDYYPQAGGVPPKKNNKTLIIILIVVGVLVLCCCCASAYYLYQNGDYILEEIERQMGMVLPLLNI